MSAYTAGPSTYTYSVYTHPVTHTEKYTCIRAVAASYLIHFVSATSHDQIICAHLQTTSAHIWIWHFYVSSQRTQYSRTHIPWWRSEWKSVCGMLACRVYTISEYTDWKYLFIYRCRIWRSRLFIWTNTDRTRCVVHIRSSIGGQINRDHIWIFWNINTPATVDSGWCCSTCAVFRFWNLECVS